jgi:carotenoid cleavage dioxygenase-like enzyme
MAFAARALELGRVLLHRRVRRIHHAKRRGVLDREEHVRLRHGAQLRDGVLARSGDARGEEGFEAPVALDGHGREQVFLGLEVAVRSARAHSEFTPERAQRNILHPALLERTKRRLHERHPQIAMMVLRDFFLWRTGHRTLKVYTEYMLTADATRLPFHLSGAFAPVAEERTDSELEVDGEIPGELCGTYVRNGPNPRTGSSPAWFAGEGMLHALRLEGGRARWYKNRWIDGRGPNTNVIGHAGRILALVETRLPVEVSPDLDTRGVFDFEGGLVRSMTAHPKRCARTGELLFFSYAATPPLLTYYRADASGRIVHRADLDVKFATYMHDFAITEHYAVFYVLPVLLGDFRSPIPIRWADDMPARIALVPRDGGTADLRWFDVAPGSISHTVNAFEDGDSVVLDAVRAPHIMQAHALYRYRLDLRTGLASESVLDPRFLDFPRVSPAVVGQRQRHAYTTELDGFTSDGGFTRTRVHQYDFETRSSRTHDFGADAMPGECVVVPKCASQAESEAWVMLFVHGRDAWSTEFVILDAAHFAAPPVARIRLPGRVPVGLHGDWIDDAAT